MNLRQAYLMMSAFGVIVLGLSYGAAPQTSMPLLFDLNMTDPKVIHILRAVMGLYIALALFWVLGALRTEYRQAALYSHLVFVSGLGMGRLVDMLASGPAHWLLTSYMLVEFFFTAVAIWMIKRPE